MRVRVLADAENEAQEAALWYERQRQGLGVEFLDSLEGALRAIEITPQGFTKIRRAGRAREVLVLAVAHVRRRPFYWKKRDG